MTFYLRLEDGFRPDSIPPHSLAALQGLPLVLEDDPVVRDALLAAHMLLYLPDRFARRQT